MQEVTTKIQDFEATMMAECRLNCSKQKEELREKESLTKSWHDGNPIRQEMERLPNWVPDLGQILNTLLNS